VHDLIEILRYRNTGLIFWVNSGICGAFLAFTGLWGVPFFVQHHALSVKEASLVTSAMLVLFAVGGPLFGVLSDRVKRRKLPFVAGSSLTVIGFGTLAIVPDAPLVVLVPLLVAAGFGAGSMALSFGFAKESVPPRLQGAVTGMVNTGVMVGALTLMPAIGLVLDAKWLGAIANGVRLYPLDAFRVGWWVLAGWIAVSAALLLLTRETHAHQSA
jgi:MFS family permease